MKGFDAQEARHHIYKLISSERDVQDAKWGPQRHPWSQWLAVLVEEVGEVSEEILRLEFGHEAELIRLEEELVQVCAVAVHMLEQLAEYRGSGKR